MPRAVVTIALRGARSALADLQGVTRGIEDAARAEARAATAADRAMRAKSGAAVEKARMLREEAAQRKRAVREAVSERQAMIAAHEKAEKERRAATGATEKAFSASEARKAKAAEYAARKQARDAERAAKQAARAATAAAREQERVARRLAESQAREAQRALRARERAERQATRAARQEAARQERIARQTAATRAQIAARYVRATGGAAKVLAGGALAGGIASMGTARSTLGVDDVQTRVQRANSFKEQLLTTAVDADLTKQETAAAEQKILKASKASAVSPEELMQGLSIAHERFNAFKPFVENIDEIARAAKASKTPLEDMIGMLGSAQTAYGLNADQVREAMDIMLAGARTGAIAPQDFAGPMASAMGSHALNTGQTGIEGVRQFVGLMQTVGAGQFGANETETRATQFVSMLSRGEIAKKLTRIGVQIRGDDGKVDLGRVVEQLANNAKFATPTQRQAIFHDKEAREAIETMINQLRKVRGGDTQAVDFASMAAVDRSIGAKTTDEKMQRMEESGLLDLQRQGVDMQVDTIRNLQSYNDQLLSVVKVSNRLETSFGALGLWANSIAAAGAGGLATSVLSKMGGKAGGGILGKAAGKLGGTKIVGGLLARLGLGALIGGGSAVAGGAAAAGGLAGAAGAAGGVAAGGATAAGGIALAPILATVATVAAAGYAANEATRWATGDSIVEHIGKWFSGEDKKRDATASKDLTGQPGELDREQSARIAELSANDEKQREDLVEAKREPVGVDLRIDIHQYDHRTQIATAAKSPGGVNVSTSSGQLSFGGS